MAENAVTIIRDLNNDAEMRQRALEREMLLHDKASALGKAKRDGIKEGRAEGKAEERAELINKMRKSGMTEEQIQKIINL